MMATLVCNVGWMQRYEGMRRGDAIKGGGTYVAEHGMGHEVCNFLRDGDRVYGYVQQRGAMNLKRMGAKNTDESIDGVTVIWTAKRPKGKTVVVGWYRAATVFKHYQRHQSARSERTKLGITRYNIVAPWEHARLLTDDERNIEVPRGRGGMGQSLVWYPDTEVGQAFVTDVKLAIAGRRRSVTEKPPRSSDPLRNAEVERAAVQCVTRHYQRLGYAIRSVEKDNVGWDIEANAGFTKLRIEVKGLSGPTAFVELTPNEYKAFSAREPDYRLAVVTQALDGPCLVVCRYDNELEMTVTESPAGLPVEVVERTGGQVRVHR